MKKIISLIMMILLAVSVAAVDPDIVLDAIDPSNIDEGDTLTVDLSTYVTNEGSFGPTDLTYEVSPSSPGSLTGDVFTFTPAFDESGTYVFTFTVKNGTDQDSDTVTVNVADVPADLTVSEIKIGDDSQLRGVESSSTFTIKNDGGDTVTGLSVSVTSTDSDAALEITSVSSTTVGPGAEVTVGIKGFVPLDLDAVDSSGRKVSLKVGSVTITSSAPTVEADVDMEAKNMLKIKDADIFFDGEKEGFDDGEEVKDIRPGDDVELVFEVENRFDDKGDCEDEGTDCEIENVEMEIVIDDGDLDIEEDIDFGDLKADDKEEDSTTFDIDNDVDEDTYEMEISLTGEDTNGARHGEYWEVTLDVEKEKDELSIVDVFVDPSSVSCDRDVEIDVSIENTGRDDQKQGLVTIRNKKLDLFDKTTPFRLDEDKDTTKTFEFTVSSGQEAGSYTIEIEVYYDIDESSDVEMATLTVRECSTEPDDDVVVDEPDDDVIYIDDDEIPEIPTDDVIVGRPAEGEEDFLGSTGYVALLVVGILVVLLLIVLLLSSLMKK